jgi:hypothetical protein
VFLHEVCGVCNDVHVVKKYVVRLSSAERKELEVMVQVGKRPAKELIKARILLKADISASARETMKPRQRCGRYVKLFQ